MYKREIAFNLLPIIGDLDEQGHASEESKMVFETKKILSRRDLAVMATAVRVPVFYGHGQTVVCELNCPVSRSELIQAVSGAAGAEVREGGQELATPKDVQGKRETYISRLRLGEPYVEKTGEKTAPEKSSWVQMWNVADNLKKGCCDQRSPNSAMFSGAR